MRMAGLLVMALFTVAAQAQAQPAPVFAEFSSIYDSYKHRRHLPNCPSEQIVAPHMAHAMDLWEKQGDRIMAGIRRVTEMPGFPKRQVIVYLIACGRSISDPATVAIYTGGPEGPFRRLTDEELLADIAHELLHQAASSPAYADARYFIRTAYPGEEDDTTNHILVAAMESRLYGYEALKARYASNAAYARALELAMLFGIGSQEPWPEQTAPQ